MYIYHINSSQTSEILDRAYIVVNYWWGLVFNLALGSVIYWPLLILSGSPLFASMSLLLSVIIYIYGIYNASKIVIKPITVEFLTLPSEWEGKKIAFISDVHAGIINGSKFVKKVFDAVIETDAELLLIGGDLFDSNHADYNDIISPIEPSRLRQGVYYVTGNHEYFIDYNNVLKPVIEARGIHILDNNAVNLMGLNIGGINHSLSELNFDFRPIFKSLKFQPNQPNILLYHEPVPADSKYALAHNTNLLLSGHTHYGQLAPFNIITKFLYGDFDFGLYIEPLGQNVQYTSSGVGSWGPPVRTTARPEVVVITLQQKKL